MSIKKRSAGIKKPIEKPLEKKIRKLPTKKDKKLIAIAKDKSAFRVGLNAKNWGLGPEEYNKYVHEARLVVEKRLKQYIADGKTQQAAYLKAKYKASSEGGALSEDGEIKYRKGKAWGIGSTVLAGLAIVGIIVGIATAIPKNNALAEKNETITKQEGTIDNLQQEKDKTQGELDNTKEQLDDAKGENQDLENNLAQQNIDAAKNSVNQSFYDAFGLTYDGLAAGKLSAYNMIENEAKNFTGNAKNSDANSEYAQAAQAHLDNIAALLDNKDAATVRDEILNAIDENNFADKEKEASALTSNVLIERFMYLANLAASKGCDLQSTMATLEKTYGADLLNKYNDIVKNINDNITDALELVDGLNSDEAQELKKLLILLQDDGSNPVWLVKQASELVSTLESNLREAKAVQAQEAAEKAKQEAEQAQQKAEKENQELQDKLDQQNIPDPSVDDWQDAWFDESSEQARIDLETKLLKGLGTNLTGVVANDKDFVKNMPSYNENNKTLTILMKTNKADQFVKVVLAGVEKREYSAGEIADLIENREIGVKESKLYRAYSIYSDKGENTLFVSCKVKSYVDQTTGANQSKISGEVYVDGFGGIAVVYDNIVLDGTYGANAAAEALAQVFAAEHGLTMGGSAVAIAPGIDAEFQPEQ